MKFYPLDSEKMADIQKQIEERKSTTTTPA
jgi:Na+/melibiose symporter-like transporter